MDIHKLKAEQKLLKEWSYDWHPIERGYNNRTLYINVGSNEVKEKPVSQEMKDKFVGGKGFGLRLLWDATIPTTKWDDPENEIIISPGQLVVLPNILVPENHYWLQFLRKPILLWIRT